VGDDPAAGAVDPTVPLLLGAEWRPEVPDGLNRYFAELIDALRRRGMSPRATVLGPATGAPSGVVAGGDARLPLPLRLSRFRAAAEGAGRGADVIDAHFALYAFWPVLLGGLRRIPLVVHFQGPWADESTVARNEHVVVVAAKRLVERLVYRRATTVVTLSAAFKRILVERYGVLPWRIRVIPPGVDLQRFHPGDRAAARRRLGVPARGPLVACVRRLESRMGIDILVEAWSKVQRDVPGSHLVIVGDGPERRRLEALVARHGLRSTVTFAGRVDEPTLVACHQAADLTVVPSTALEGFGLVVLESLACGTPVVVSDVGGLPEAVRGLDPTVIVPAGDARRLAEALGRCLTDDDSTPSRVRCRAHAEAHGWDTVAAEHVRMYTEALSPPPARLRVVYLDHCAQLSGAEIALLNLLPALGDVDSHVILGEDGPLVSKLLGQGTSVEVLSLADVARNVSRDQVRPGALPARGIVTTIRYVLRLAGRLRRLRPDLVHTNSLKAALYGGVAARLAGIPVIWHVHDRIAPDYLPGAAVALVRLMALVLPRRIVANSRSTLETLGRAGRHAVVVAYPLRPGLANGAGSPDRSDGPVRIGMIGRLTPWKGQHVFLDAFARAFPNGTEEAAIVGGALFGEHEYAESLVRQAGSLGLDGRLEFRGFCDDLVAELHRMDIVVHASTVPEPFGQVVTEAMAAGVPVVAAGAGGPAETIQHGLTGLLCPPGDVEALATTLRRLSDDPELRGRLSVAGQQRARDFSPERIAGQIMSVYRGVSSAGAESS